LWLIVVSGGSWRSSGDHHGSGRPPFGNFQRAIFFIMPIIPLNNFFYNKDCCYVIKKGNKHLYFSFSSKLKFHRNKKSENTCTNCTFFASMQ